MRKRPLVALLLGIAVLCACSSKTATAPSSIALLETGSSLLYPLMNIWVAAYQKHTPGLEITTQSTGSGTGIAQAVSGVAQIGASDAYMSSGQLAASPMLNIPLAISAQQINYNLPGLNRVHLRLSGPVLAAIYSGTITFWNDPQIVAMNPSLAAKLPRHQIVPIHRSDGSGDTFIFSQYLAFSTPSWKRNPGFGTTISWPSVTNAVGANGNPGMVQSCQTTPYSIAYIGVSFLDETNAAHLGYAALKNRAGNFVLPTPKSIAAAAQSLASQTPRNERISLVFAPGSDSYPIINYEYAIVNTHGADAATQTALTRFLTWTISPFGGQAAHFLAHVHFLPLPLAIQRLSRTQIASIQ